MRKLIAAVIAGTLFQTAIAADIKTEMKNKAASLGGKMGKYLEANVKALGAALTGTGIIKMLNGKSFSAPVSTSTASGSIKLLVSPTGELGVEINGILPATRVSGICEEGFITCDPGTWNNCQYYRLTSSGAKKVTPDVLTSCYCVSQPVCNFKWNDYWLKWTLDKFTRMIGYESKSFVDIVKFPKAVRDFSSLTSSKTKLPTMADVLSPDTSLLVSNPILKEINNNPNYKSSDTFTCTIENHINTLGTNTINTSLYFLNNLPAGIVCSYLDNTADPSVKKCYLQTNNGYCSVSASYYLGGKAGVSWKIPDDPRIYLKVGKKILIDKSVKSKGTTSSSGTKEFSISGKELVSYYIANLGACNGKPTGSIWTYVKELPNISVTHSDSCSGTSPKCKLKEEYICPVPPSQSLPRIDDSNYKKYGCFRTVHNYINQPVTIPDKCFTYYSSNFGNMWTICENGQKITAVNTVSGETITLANYAYPQGWTYIERIYTCPKGTGIDTTEAKNRFEEMETNSTYNGNEISYSGNYSCISKDGRWYCPVTDTFYGTKTICEANCDENVKTQVDNQPIFPVCRIGNYTGAWVCKVASKGGIKRVVDNKPVSFDFSANETYEFRACIPQTNNGTVTYTCPIYDPDNETVVENCTCDTSNETLKALSTIQMLNAASKDITCSNE